MLCGQALVARDKEPITPFISRVRGLYDQDGVSSILVIGGAGDYFDVCDTVRASPIQKPALFKSQPHTTPHTPHSTPNPANPHWNPAPASIACCP